MTVLSPFKQVQINIPVEIKIEVDAKRQYVIANTRKAVLACTLQTSPGN